MPTSGARLRHYMEARYLELGLGPRHGFVTDMERRTGVLRATLTGWFGKRGSVPRLDGLRACAKVLEVTRAELVAAFDGDELITFDRARQIVREEMAAARQAEEAAVEERTPRKRAVRNGGNGPRSGSGTAA